MPVTRTNCVRCGAECDTMAYTRSGDGHLCLSCWRVSRGVQSDHLMHLRVPHVVIRGYGAPFESGADAAACDEMQAMYDMLTDNRQRVTCRDCRRSRAFE